MSDQEKFLQRWSRRKQEAESEAKQQPAETLDPPENPEEEERHVSPASPAKTQEAKPAFDLESLPSLDSITATTDIRAFLAPGVPEELKHAALRRVWRTDPAIRDFIGLSENSWDFNDPTGAHGFGPLEVTEQLKKAVEAMFDRKLSSPENRTKEEEQNDNRLQSANPLEIARHEPANEINDQIFDTTHPVRPDEKFIALPKRDARPEKANERVVRRGHGSALPK
jgi:hypothetical protein